MSPPDQPNSFPGFAEGFYGSPIEEVVLSINKVSLTTDKLNLSDSKARRFAGEPGLHESKANRNIGVADKQEGFPGPQLGI